MSTDSPQIAAIPCDTSSASRLGRLGLKLLGSTERTQALSVWRELEVSLSNRRLMCSSIWTETWLTHYGHLIPHRFAVAVRDDIPLGIALLTNGVGQHAGPLPLNTWHVGTSGELDADSVCIEYNTLLVRDDDRTEFTKLLMKWAENQSGCDQTHLDGFVLSDVAPLLTENSEAIINRRPSRYFDLRAARERNVDPIELLGSNTRATLRRSLRRLEQPRGEWSETAAQAEEMLHQLIERHQARWVSIGQPGVYASRLFREFHLDLVHRLVPVGAMGLFRVSSPAGVLGCTQILIDDNRALSYQSGWTGESKGASPGMVVDYLCIEECLRRGFDQFDFLAGDTENKSRLSTHAHELVWVTWRRPSLKFSLLDNLRRIKNLLSLATGSKRDKPQSSPDEPTHEAKTSTERGVH